ncbi:hypothetical protein E4P41_02530 [Geodermatophilus sp. DF01-2]|uniref:hypothetical protein n=1 Tax=Geodermatophilus sp. DF01-2 TaxID=2559610 RepID=UPI00107363E9|nr:hypothetical protein [Geodermatophilus sp. DF01_2]TFV64135.1 hypothetical protein E4P41_02530 [Geodermatophilus sp. DF01_2]
MPIPSTAAAATAAEAETADTIAAAVTACPAVAALHGGGLRRTATYLPGRRVDGVRLADDRIEVSVVAVQGAPVALLADQVRAAVAPLAGGRVVDVHVADLQLFEEQPPALPAGPSAGIRAPELR